MSEPLHAETAALARVRALSRQPWSDEHVGELDSRLLQVRGILNVLLFQYGQLDGSREEWRSGMALVLLRVRTLLEECCALLDVPEAPANGLASRLQEARAVVGMIEECFFKFEGTHDMEPFDAETTYGTLSACHQLVAEAFLIIRAPVSAVQH
jgi:hypothetical protein